MQGQTHLVTGALAGLTVAVVGRISNPATLAAYAGLGALGGLIPDWLQINVPGASKQVKGMFGHRGFSHWAWTALAVWWCGSVTIGAYALPLAAGWASHILLDAFADGVPAFWPFGRTTLAHIKTGGREDTFVGAAALVLAGLVLAGLLL